MVNQADEAQFLAALRRARDAAVQAARIEPQAIDVSYDSQNHLIVVRLNNGAVFSFPPDIAQGINGAAPEDLAMVEVTPSGTGLHWEKLDADFTVSGLLNGIFGTRTWMMELQER
ncbi:DUF2442 domain-containing protein [Nodosilinea sp. LEGE 07298]|uniref:DUF2442 domain-containing protein n=1 Tax=Nodosilinea sp. LEGE 07298 TaxID=2777970 RepID=UPI00187F6A6F|nr:DUF2442 domain-containing protein [Nodosilinea sp. LEGE 07298]MBE9111059.1 DUF2442 domain-containing protein [Nodosilinea sp. LEGE 07298]